MSDSNARFDDVNKAFDDNTIVDCDDETLQKHLLSLSIEWIANQGLSHRNVIRGITINHILLQRHIDRLNKQNSKIQKWVIALAVAALIAAVVQTTVAIRAELRPTPMTQSSLPLQQQSKPPMAAPSQATPQTSHPAIGKKP